jgi:hypothetical protein
MRSPASAPSSTRCEVVCRGGRSDTGRLLAPDIARSEDPSGGRRDKDRAVHLRRARDHALDVVHEVNVVLPWSTWRIVPTLAWIQKRVPSCGELLKRGQVKPVIGYWRRRSGHERGRGEKLALHNPPSTRKGIHKFTFSPSISPFQYCLPTAAAYWEILGASPCAVTRPPQDCLHAGVAVP